MRLAYAKVQASFASAKEIYNNSEKRVSIMTKEQYKQELGKREQQKNDNSVLEYSNSKIDYFLKKMIYHLDRIDNQIDDQNRARFTAICKQSMIALEEQSMIALESEIVDQNESVTRLLTV